MILISFEDLQKIHNFSKLQGCGSKIGSATPIWISKFKRAWQAQFLSYNLETLEKWVFFEDVQMILLSFFHISPSFQLRKNTFKSSVHILRRPWLGPQKNNVQFQKFFLSWFCHFRRAKNILPENHFGMGIICWFGHFVPWCTLLETQNYI